MDKESNALRVIAIDPSTSHMGVTLIDVNITEIDKFKLIYVNTIHGEKVNYNVPYQYDDNGKVLSRAYGLVRAYKELLAIYNPDVAICEDNYLGADPRAYKRLIEVVTMLKVATEQNNNNIPMNFVLPNIAKAIVGANFRGTKKEDVAKGIMNYENLDTGKYDIIQLDEHSTDSVAIGLFMAEKIARDYNVAIK